MLELSVKPPLKLKVLASRKLPQDIGYQTYISFREENLRRGSEYTPWYSGQNKFATQSGTGGFLKVRDVLPHMKGGKEIPEELKQRSEGIVPLQSGTNKLASQRGMTGLSFFRYIRKYKTYRLWNTS